jgi:phosphatidate cytidylyltransferase
MYDVFFIDHNLFCCMLFMIGLIIFTLSLRKGQYKYQFQRLGWITLSAVLPISASLFFGYYVYKGYFWMVVTNGSVMINDIMAFVFGKTFGKTPLIKLSPNKTVEGFVGGGISTIIFAIWVSQQIHLFTYAIFFRSPVKFLTINKSHAQQTS